MTRNQRPLCVKIQFTDGESGETVTETVVIRAAEGEDKLRLFRDEAESAVDSACETMRDRYAGLHQ